MLRRAEAEPKLRRAELDDVSVAQAFLLGRFAVDSQTALRRSAHDKDVVGLQGDFRVPIPHAWLIQRKVGVARAAKLYRKTAGHVLGTRRFAVNQLELDHLSENDSLVDDNLIVGVNRQIKLWILDRLVPVDLLFLAIFADDFDFLAVGKV